MNAGLSNLITLKRRVLPEEEVTSTDFDDTLQILGKGVAAQFDHYCNRNFTRTTGDIKTFAADRSFCVLPRYPVESVSAVELRYSQDEAWADISSRIMHTENDSGMLYFDSEIGPWRSRVRVTWDGGYWFDTTEEFTGSLPSGATELPADLKHAWLTQCAFVWQQMEKLGIALEGKPDGRSALQEIELLLDVKETLNRYKCYDLS